MKCVDCAYCWKNDDEKYARCHFEPCCADDGGCPPLMEELLDDKIEELAEISAEIIKYQKGE